MQYIKCHNFAQVSVVLSVKERWMQGVLLPVWGWWCPFLAGSQGGRGRWERRCNSSFPWWVLTFSLPWAHRLSWGGGRIYLPLPLSIPSQVLVPCAGWTGLWHTEEGSIEQPGVERAPWTQKRWYGIKNLIVLQDPWPPLDLSYPNLMFSSGWELPWVYQSYAGIY